MDRNTMLLRIIKAERDRCLRLYRDQYDSWTRDLLRMPVDMQAFDYRVMVVLMDKLIAAGFDGPIYKLVDRMPTRFKYGDLEVSIGVSIDTDEGEVYARVWSETNAVQEDVCIAKAIAHRDGSFTCSDINMYRLLLK